ncbi:TraM recognition domain-containing protein [Pedobacter sp. MC2016-24]|uniref:TraM recognition domain-containing protein n=1 Tax=Pedobacter sp. MC2016-24 TaxID=2780090 RepID=UPI001880A9CB|nr:TraM recognition domain-containing protein [Pedobacter sp. MC2016-24]MBE9602647.1 TraM recognition domain-containing protein [Pedobacter sp. MC2016-24]
MKWYDINQPLLKFKSSKVDTAFTIKDSFEAVSIMGSTGSGKTSTSFSQIASAYLSHGYGALLLTVKKTDKSDFLKLCEQTGRMDHVRVIGVGQPYKFNFLEYECQQPDGSLGLTENIVDLLTSVINAGLDDKGSSSEDSFWSDALTMVLSSVIDLCKIAYQTVTVQLIYDIGQSLPKKEDNLKELLAGDTKTPTAFQKAYFKARKNIVQQAGEWESKLSQERLDELEDNERYEDALFEAVPDARTFKMIDQFFVETLKNLADRTRSVVDFKLMGFLFPLLKSPIYPLFCMGKSNITPDMCSDGAIIIIDMPTKEYFQAGRSIQLIFKLLFQRAMERRPINLQTRPVALISDEAQTFIVNKDLNFQLTARSSKIAILYVTQNILNYYSAMGGKNPEYLAKSLLANFTTKIFHCNTGETNEWASSLIGEDYFLDQNYSSTYSKEYSQSNGASYSLRRILRPEVFSKLKMGSEISNNLVEAIIHKQGNPIDGVDNHLLVTFRQSPRIAG